MDDTARLALIRAVLGTWTTNYEADDGDRNLADKALCINALDDIANADDPDIEDLERDEWITRDTAARIRTIASIADTVAPAIVGITPGQWRIETGADPAMVGAFATGRLHCVPCTWYAWETAAGHDTIAATFGLSTDLAELLAAAAAHQCPALVTGAYEKAHSTDGH